MSAPELLLRKSWIHLSIDGISVRVEVGIASHAQYTRGA